MKPRTRLIYQYDSYVREHEARVIDVRGTHVFLDETIFHPRSGGVDCDTGFIHVGNEIVEVVEVVFDKETGEIAHKLSRAVNITPGIRVKMTINWDRRYRLMRLHTAVHVLSAVMYNDYGALVSGGNITQEYAYDDYTIERFEKEIFMKAIEKANEIVRKDLEVKIYWLPRTEAMKIPGVVKLASRMPPDIEELRIVEIPGVDIQADGGPHVRRTGEIGEILFIKAENKGKSKRRVYFNVVP